MEKNIGNGENNQKKKSPREGTSYRDPLVCTFWNPLKKLEDITYMQGTYRVKREKKNT